MDKSKVKLNVSLNDLEIAFSIWDKESKEVPEDFASVEYCKENNININESQAEALYDYLIKIINKKNG